MLGLVACVKAVSAPKREDTQGMPRWYLAVLGPRCLSPSAPSSRHGLTPWSPGRPLRCPPRRVNPAAAGTIGGTWREAEAQVSYRIREVAERANVPEGFVRRLISVGALPREEAGLGAREVRRARLLRSWEAAGLSVESIVTLVDRGALSLMFLDAPVMETPERLDRSYEELAADRGVPVALLQALHQALGFAPPDPGDRAGEDDLTMLAVAEMFRGAGADDQATLRLLAVYADGLRRIAMAEADLYEANMVNEISRSRGGRPVRWLGDGGDVPLPGALDGRDRRTRRGRAHHHRRPATRPCWHPHRSRRLPGRGRLRKDGEPGRQDRVARTGRTGHRERGDRPPIRPS
jgi:adenylate cyclase regulatory protein